MHGIRCVLLLQMQRSVVYVSVCLSVTTASHAKPAEPMEVLFGVWTRERPKEPCFR